MDLWGGTCVYAEVFFHASAAQRITLCRELMVAL
jgi:hypothetical protein